MNNFSKFIKDQCDRAEGEIATLLSTLPSLPEKLKALNRHQLATGFIKDDLKSVTRCRLVDPDPQRTHHFLVQYNPRRAQRESAAPRPIPPPNVESINGGCFLCPDNIWWQQYGLEISFDVLLNERKYKAWANPFPLKESHFTVATVEHRPQSWTNASEETSGLREMLEDLIELADQVPDFLVFYNGAGAGASLPYHRHFQCFPRDDREPFPLEKTAQQRLSVGRGVHVSDYPITALHFCGTVAAKKAFVETVDNWTSAWTNVTGPDAVSANIIATVEAIPEHPGHPFHLYFVHRNRLYSRGPGMTGQVGGLEVLGELVFSTEAEKERLDAGLVNYDYARRVLAAVEAPGVRDFLRTVF